jgi:hypothetical protein
MRFKAEILVRVGSGQGSNRSARLRPTSNAGRPLGTYGGVRGV